MSTVFPTPSFSLRREEFLLILHVMNHKRPRLFHLLVVTICVVRFKLLSLTRFFPALSLPWVALRAAAFQLAVGAGGAVHAAAFQLAVGAGVALHAAVFHLAVRTRVATTQWLFSFPCEHRFRSIASRVRRYRADSTSGRVWLSHFPTTHQTVSLPRKRPSENDRERACTKCGSFECPDSTRR